MRSRLCQLVNFGAYNGNIFSLFIIFQQEARNVFCSTPIRLHLLEKNKIICRLLSAALLNIMTDKISIPPNFVPSTSELLTSILIPEFFIFSHFAITIRFVAVRGNPLKLWNGTHKYHQQQLKQEKCSQDANCLEFALFKQQLKGWSNVCHCTNWIKSWFRLLCFKTSSN